MSFKLGAVMVKGGKIISTGYNHHRTHYDGAEAQTRGHRKPVSMHAEMHAIFNLTGMSPSFKQQVQRTKREQSPTRPKNARGPKRKTGPKWCLSGKNASEVEAEEEPGGISVSGAGVRWRDSGGRGVAL